MTLIRRVIGPLVVGVIATLALVAPGSVGAIGKPIVVGATGSSGATGPTGTPQILTASVTSCHADPLQGNRYAIFASQMTSVPSTRIMSVNFELQVRSGAATAFTFVKNAPGFGAWVSSQPGVGVYTYSHEVTSLPAPASFRVLVNARWLDRHRRVIRREDLFSPVCVQPAETPNLAIGALRHTHAAAGSTTEVYSVRVVNAGAVAAGAFQVSLTVNGVTLPSASVPSLAAETAQVVQFSAPACTAGSTLTAVADPTGAVTEPANPNRTRTFPCTR
jgi:hypothetical protein